MYPSNHHQILLRMGWIYPQINAGWTKSAAGSQSNVLRVSSASSSSNTVAVWCETICLIMTKSSDIICHCALEIVKEKIPSVGMENWNKGLQIGRRARYPCATEPYFVSMRNDVPSVCVALKRHQVSSEGAGNWTKSFQVARRACLSICHRTALYLDE